MRLPKMDRKKRLFTLSWHSVPTPRRGIQFPTALLTRLLSSQARRMPAAIGLEVFDSSGPALFGGKKKLSIRDFALPDDVLGKSLVLLSRPHDAPALPDSAPAGSQLFKVAGFIVFSGCKSYSTREAFEADRALHEVLPGTPVYEKYAGAEDGPWPGPLGDVYGWEIASAQPAPAAFVQDEPAPSISRRHKALFDVQMEWEIVAVPPKP